jgi:hypothetical protein
MNRQCVVAASVLGIAACATPDPEPPVSDSAVETSAESGTEASSETVIEDVDVPEVPKAARIEGQANISDPDALVCREITRTGSHLSKLVCRTRSEIEQRRTADQRELERIQKRSRIPEPPPDQ